MNHNNNILILTPDRVGSTFLQRFITILMNAHKYDRPVINLHELTNGITRYYNSEYNCEILGRCNRVEGKRGGYHQSLSEVVDLLSSVDHYKTSRLALYHILQRNDSIAEQVEFYKYLNENFFIISAQRENLLEHAISWVIVTHSKKLNVYSPLEKQNIFETFYNGKIKVPHQSLIKYLNEYKKYLEWVDQYFTVGSYFVYEKDMPRVEEFCFELPCFNNQEKRNWNDIFDIKFEDWNRCHYLVGDISGLSRQVEPTLLLENKSGEPNYQLDLPTTKNIVQSLSRTDQQYLSNNSEAYIKSSQAIEELKKNGPLPSGMPMKLQTMVEKKLMIGNFDEVASWYNEWVVENGIGKPYNIDESIVKELEELRTWHSSPSISPSKHKKRLTKESE